LQRLRQIHEADGYVVRESPEDCLPFGREDGERVVDTLPGRVRLVDQQGNGRTHVGVRGEGDERVGVWWTFNEDNVRLHGVQSLYKAARRTGSMMTNTEDAYQSLISRQAR
jgi:hypothetical protein